TISRGAMSKFLVKSKGSALHRHAPAKPEAGTRTETRTAVKPSRESTVRQTGDPMLYDITPMVSDRLQVWPGDIRPRRHVTMDMKRGDHLTLSSFKATVHLGAHADAPSHYGPDGRTMEAQDLSYYLGACQVIGLH